MRLSHSRVGRWRWSITDVLAVANVMTMGATFSSVAGAGNEPTFCASFAAGIAMRMFLYEALPPAATGWLAAQTRSATKIEVSGRASERAERASATAAEPTPNRRRADAGPPPSTPNKAV